MAKYEVKGNKGTYVINGNDSSSEIKRGGSILTSKRQKLANWNVTYSRLKIIAADFIK